MKIISKAFREESHIAFKENKVRSLTDFFTNTTEVRNSGMISLKCWMKITATEELCVLEEYPLE